MDNTISLNKFISDTGYCSRREADNLITAGRVLLNNRPAMLGNRYKPGDTVEVDGSLITAAKKEKRVYLALNKPTGITTTTELHIKDNIISFVGYPKRIFPIGRLDKDSEGLILLTNDGDIINKILRADNHHEKEYVVRVNKPIDAGFLHQMANGVPILDTVTLPCKVQPMGRQTFRITLTQGLNRQIRRMCEQLGYAVVGLQRVRIMNIRIDKLALGKWRYLSDVELSALMETIADSSKEEMPKKKAPRRHKGGAENRPVQKEDQQNSAKKAVVQKGAKPWKSEDKRQPGKKAAKPWKSEDKLAAGKKAAKPWKSEFKSEHPAKNSTKGGKPQHSAPKKNAGKEKKHHEGKRNESNSNNKTEKRPPAPGSFKSYRNKGRRG